MPECHEACQGNLSVRIRLLRYCRYIASHMQAERTRLRQAVPTRDTAKLGARLVLQRRWQRRPCRQAPQSCTTTMTVRCGEMKSDESVKPPLTTPIFVLISHDWSRPIKHRAHQIMYHVHANKLKEFLVLIHYKASSTRTWNSANLRLAFH